MNLENITMTKKRINFIQLLPIIIFSALVPLIIYTRYVHLDDFTAIHWLGYTISPDVFTYYKMIVIIACALVSLIIMIINFFQKKSKLKLSFALIMILLYSVLLILSAVFSEYPKTAFWGAPERYEGAISVLSYLIMFVYSLMVIDSIKKVRTIFLSIIISSAVIAVISSLQFLGFSIYNIEFIKSILNMTPTATNSFEFDIIHQQYTSFGTMANPNNLGIYISLIFPIVFILLSKITVKKYLLLTGVLLYLLILSLFGSSSSGGYYAVFISTVLLIFLSWKYIKNNVVNLSILAVIVMGLLIVTNIFTDNRIGNKMNLLSASSELNEAKTESGYIYIDDIILGENDVFIDTTDKDMLISNVNKQISVKDANGINLPVYIYNGEGSASFPGDIIPFEDPSYKDYVILANEDYSIFSLKAGYRTMYFHMTEDGVRVSGMNNTLDTIHPIERNQFLYKHFYLFSGRGYIWSGMLPLIKDNIFLGNGSDTTYLTYPQNDYIGKINMHGSFNIIIEKPHCYYLQIAHDTGWLSLIILLTLFGYYIIDTFILQIKSKRWDSWRLYSISSFCAVAAYLIASIMYDSSVMTAPVFWIILALGFSLNTIGRKYEKKV